MTPFLYGLRQWFPTGVPRHTRVLKRGVRGAAKFRVTGFLLIIYYIECHKLSFLTQLKGCRQNFLVDLKGAVNQKRLKNTGLRAFTVFTKPLIPCLLNVWHQFIFLLSFFAWKRFNAQFYGPFTLILCPKSVVLNDGVGTHLCVVSFF